MNRPAGFRSIRLRAMVAAFLAIIAFPAAAADPALPTDPAQAARATIDAFNDIFGKHPGYRPVHAKGIVVEGQFEASPEAASITRATHMDGSVVPVVVRFSDFAGLPTIASGDGAGSPRGMAIRFILPDDVSTDIVAHSYNGFPAGNVVDFLAFLRAVGKGSAAVEGFAAGHPAARRFLETPKPPPSSYAREAYYGVTAFAFVDDQGIRRYGRYRIVPEGGTDHLAAEEAAAAAPDYLREEMAERLGRGPARFRLLLQLAGPGDDVADSSKTWGEDRQVVDLGTITLERVVSDSAARERELAFIPLNLVDGIETSEDPLLVARTRAYFESRLRRMDGPTD